MSSAQTSTIAKQRASDAVIARMRNGEPFTYAALGAVAAAHGAHEGRDRIADRTIQRWRKKGWIEFTREGRNVVWRLTELGHAEMPSGDSQ